ncbi:TIGR03749 family integrating conjugative element protein [Saezia sanguinis]|uniref:TIGR03749 family integrating conjugative element protein n=1 Tax=Saezia sanguinis TaxID=1965230 RepID=UPI003040027D
MSHSLPRVFILSQPLRRFFILVMLLFCLPARAVEVMPWERLPLAIPLIVGQERVVFVERNVRVGLPASIQSKLRVQTASGTVYLKALSPIEPTRIQLQDAESGELILLDIVARDSDVAGETAPEPVRIVFESQSNSTQTESTGKTADQKTATPVSTPVPVVLTRYAAQNLYAPLRTVEPVTGITRTSVRSDLDVSTLLPTLPIEAKVLAAWRLQNHYVTAVRLQNRSPNSIDLDPRLLQGDFVAATFQHQYLGAIGNATDTTVVYLVTLKHGLAQSLLPAMSRFDASLNPGVHDEK